MNDDIDPTAGWAFETKQVHAGQTPDIATNARALPIYQTTSYTFRDTDHAAALFGLAEPGNIYTRIMNPTQDVVEQRIAALEGGVAALFLASGQAAETFAILNLASAGDHIVSSPRLYGGTYNLLHYTLPKLGIETTFVNDPDDLDSWRAAVRPNTKAFFAETISNPQIDVLDIPGVSSVAHENRVPLIVDNTIATPYLIQPIAHGADIVVHSATKYLGGHGTTLGGVLVERGKFDWGNGKFEDMVLPSRGYHGVKFWETFGDFAYTMKARMEVLRVHGGS
ncbi:MAG TPA: PLP-dependent transferase, partial [Mycobacterium sp.]|nr:PLP-dependent transferase [Mycobacterium sp.]